MLLENIKEDLFSLLLPQHTKIKQQISEVLDAELIRQQAEKGTLDFKVSDRRRFQGLGRCFVSGLVYESHQTCRGQFLIKRN